MGVPWVFRSSSTVIHFDGFRCYKIDSVKTGHSDTVDRLTDDERSSRGLCPPNIPEGLLYRFDRDPPRGRRGRPAGSRDEGERRDDPAGRTGLGRVRYYGCWIQNGQG